ncbi:MAG: AAA domain-containing protein [Bacteroidota bacterium]|jgi:ATP-dependent RNA/DNA helicase IGHMBP2
MHIQQAIQNLAHLLSLEKEEEQFQYFQALEKNPIEERVKKGISLFPLRMSNMETGLGEYLHFSFQNTKKIPAPLFSSGKVVEIFCGHDYRRKEVIRGTIKSITKGEITVATTCDERPDWLEDEGCGLNLVFDEHSYREMEGALKRLLAAEEGHLLRFKNIVYGMHPPQFSTEEIHLHTGLNSMQEQAVKHCLRAQDVAVIHGPPGTGKTTTLVALIRELSKTEKHILVCSPSNLAVDLLAEKLHQKGIEVLRLGNPTRISEELLSLTLDGKIVHDPGYKSLKEFRKRADEYRQMARKYKRNFGPAERAQRHLLFKESKDLLAEAREVESFLVDKHLQSATVICTTLVGASNPIIREIPFQTVLIDEAAQALEPACWIAINRGQRLILAGDHKQLPPTVKNVQAEKGGLGISLMEKLMEREGIGIMLTEQYRMNHYIMEYPSISMYGGKLHAHPSVENRVLPGNDMPRFIWPPVEWIDTAGCGFEETPPSEGRSIANSEEARLLLDYLAGLLTGLQGIPGSEEPEVGIISPYSKQVDTIRELLDEHPVLGSFTNIRVKTVDGFQGREKDIICLSLVRSNNQNEIGFLNDIRRMNVAITRAKKKLVIVGDSATICVHKYYNNLLDHCQAKGYYSSAYEYMYNQTS